jgi:hypothetical protein
VIAGAATFFVARGEPDSEDALIEALAKFGDVNMARVLLNCGNSKLEAAADRWASGHGYRITSRDSLGGGLRWGGSR